jgi:hypothetical protein
LCYFFGRGFGASARTLLDIEEFTSVDFDCLDNSRCFDYLDRFDYHVDRVGTRSIDTYAC